MKNYRSIVTTLEVFQAIRQAHPELCVFGSFSAPDGDYYGDPSRARMFTSYGFSCSDIPLIECTSSWDVDMEHCTHNNEEHHYCLCVPHKDIYE